MKDIEKYEIFYSNLLEFLDRKGKYSIGEFTIEVYKKKNVKVTMYGISKIFTEDFNDLVDLYNKVPNELKEDIDISLFSRLTMRKFRGKLFNFSKKHSSDET